MSRRYAPLMSLRNMRVGTKDDPTYIDAATFDSGHVGPKWLSDRIKQNQPLMAVRFGNTELNNLLPAFLQSQAGFTTNLKAYLRGEIPQFWFKPFLLREADLNAGIFPYGKPTVKRYARLILQMLPQIDLLGCWLHRERYLHHLFPAAALMKASDLCNPYLSAAPWTAALTGKRVLVIHPFADTIARQYREHRHRLFADSQVLPEFELLTLKAPQTNAGNRPDDMSDWFDVHDRMCAQIDRLDFDVALIGCGAYGMPLAAHVKAIGRMGCRCPAVCSPFSVSAGSAGTIRRSRSGSTTMPR